MESKGLSACTHENEFCEAQGGRQVDTRQHTEAQFRLQYLPILTYSQIVSHISYEPSPHPVASIRCVKVLLPLPEVSVSYFSPSVDFNAEFILWAGE